MATLLAVYLLAGNESPESAQDDVEEGTGKRLPEISREEPARHDSRESCSETVPHRNPETGDDCNHKNNRDDGS